MTEQTDSARPRHVPVLPAEVLAALEPSPGQVFVDATAGAGGHARLIGERLGATGRLILLDRDPSMLALARQTVEGVSCPVQYFEASFDQVREVLDRAKLARVDGLLADLGISSDQLDDAGRGFSFQREGPLDMRMNPGVGESARDLLLRLSERELADVFFHYGEERFSRRIARRVVEARQKGPLETTEQLAELVRRCVPGKRQPIDPATRVFQALRIAVNDELAALEGLLAVLPRVLRPGGRAALISFHSLEDRRVKRAFRDREVWEELTRKPVQAGDEEVRHNPRARSAKLRAARLRGPAESHERDDPGR